MREQEKQRMSARGALSILIIDPDQGDADMIDGVLTPRGHLVTRADSLGEARILCGMMAYQVLITALRLPDGDAGELLVDGGLCCKVPAIVITEKGDPPPDVVGAVGKHMGEAAHRLDAAESMRVVAMTTVRAAELAAAKGSRWARRVRGCCGRPNAS